MKTLQRVLYSSDSGIQKWKLRKASAFENVIKIKEDTNLTKPLVCIGLDDPNMNEINLIMH